MIISSSSIHRCFSLVNVCIQYTSIQFWKSALCDATKGTSTPPTLVTRAEARRWICRQNLPCWLFCWRLQVKDSVVARQCFGSLIMLNWSSYLHSRGCRFAWNDQLKKICLIKIFYGLWIRRCFCPICTSFPPRKQSNGFVGLALCVCVTKESLNATH